MPVGLMPGVTKKWHKGISSYFEVWSITGTQASNGWSWQQIYSNILEAKYVNIDFLQYNVVKPLEMSSCCNNLFVEVILISPFFSRQVQKLWKNS